MLITNSLPYDAVIFLVTSVVFYVFYAKWRLGYWSRRGIYNQKPHLIMGNAVKTTRLQEPVGVMFQEQYKDIKDRKLPHGGSYFMLQPFYIPTDINIIKNIFTTDFQHFVNHGVYFNETGDPLSAHLFAIEDDKWRQMRIKLTPTFTSGKMKMMFNTLTACTTGLRDMADEYAQSGAPLNIKEILERFTMDIISSCAFGLDSNTMKNPDSEFNRKGKLIFEPTFKNSIKNLASLAIPHSILRLINMKGIDEECSNFFMDMLRKTVDYRESKNIYRKDFLHLLIQLKNRGKVTDDGKLFNEDEKSVEGLSFDEIAAQAFVFFIAGYETSSTAMTFALYELAQQPELQEKVRNEIEKVLAKHNGEINYDSIKDMTYLEQVLHESLRKYPPVPMLVRRCNKDYPVPGTDLTLEKGIMVGISAMGIQRDPEYYPDPEKFDPDRFSEEEKAKRPAATFLPFGEGPRICIGLRFGMMQAKVGLTTLLREYNITLSKQTAVPLKFNPKIFILTADGGVWIDIQKRK